MLVSELIIKVQETAKKRTPEEKFRLLVDAHILNEDGMYDPNYFSEKTVNADIENRKLYGNPFVFK